VDSIGAPLLAGAVAASTTEDTGSASIDLLAGASDPDGSALRVENLDWHNSPGTGLPPGFTLGPDGRTLLVNTSDPAFQSLAQGRSRIFDFDYDVVDSSGARTTQSARITVAGTNDGPVAAADSRSVAEGTTTSVSGRFSGVLGNDTDPDDRETALLVVDAVQSGSGAMVPVPESGLTISGQYGILTIYRDGGYAYQASNAEGLSTGSQVDDVFTYRVIDPNGASSSAALRLTVIGANDAPNAVGDTNSVVEDGAVSATTRPAGVLGNDTDPDTGETETLVVDAVRPGSASNLSSVPTTGLTVAGEYGALTINRDGTYSYAASNADRLAQGSTGTDTFVYRTADRSGGVAEASLTFTVTGRNDAPTARPNARSVTEDQSAAGNVLTDGCARQRPGRGHGLTVYGISRVLERVGTFTTGGSITSPYGRLTINPDGPIPTLPTIGRAGPGRGQHRE
jgi:VCBS repeat-containing protein